MAQNDTILTGSPQSARIPVITGAGRGIGAAIAEAFAQSGFDIVINDINSEFAAATAKKITALKRRAHISTHDISTVVGARALISESVKAFGRIDVVVNNAGITRDALLTKMTEEQWDDVIRIDLKGVFAVGQAAAQVMATQKSGSIINIASIAHLGNVGQSNYSAAKAGVVAMTKTWALELARFGIRVNAIAPGFIDTPLAQAVPAEIKERFVQRIPARRFGRPEEIAALADFLASDRASYITGQCIQADGGLAVGLGSM
jgi:3-oxoacyl-[acyl-carrier protein] reductase